MLMQGLPHAPCRMRSMLAYKDMHAVNAHTYGNRATPPPNWYHGNRHI
jgi:hypothetical protein